METMKKLALPVLVMTSALAAPSLWAAEKALATVNGSAITPSMVKEYKEQNPSSEPQAGEDDARLLDELIGRELVYQDAIAKKLDKDPQVVKQLEYLRRQVLLNAALSKAVGSREISEEMMKKEYEARVANLNLQEYKARHILVKTENEAKAIIGELDKGGDFAKLADKYSTDPGSKSKGGELDWFGPGQMVQPFFVATQGLTKGSYTKEPVQSQYGWHVIKLEDIRKGEPPAFEKVKEQTRAMIQQRYVNEYLLSLKNKAKISKP